MSEPEAREALRRLAEDNARRIAVLENDQALFERRVLKEISELQSIVMRALTRKQEDGRLPAVEFGD